MLHATYYMLPAIMAIGLKTLYQILLGQGCMGPALLHCQEQRRLQQPFHVGFVYSPPSTVKLNSMSVLEGLLKLCWAGLNITEA